MESVYRCYIALSACLAPETGLGGKLLWAGEPVAAAHLLRAANIAGAASLAASADAGILRQAMRDGILDFVVTNLDEALRILKNEIRKKQSVAVGVSLALDAITREMVVRGVQPDLLAPGLPPSPELAAFIAHGAHTIEPPSSRASFHIIPIPPDWKQPIAAFDARLLDCLAADDHINRRWVHLAPRYLPSAARRLRSIACARASQLPSLCPGLPDLRRAE